MAMSRWVGTPWWQSKGRKPERRRKARESKRVRALMWNPYSEQFRLIGEEGREDFGRSLGEEAWKDLTL